MVPYFSALPAENRDRLLQLSADGLVAAKQEISYAKHTLEASARMLTTTVAIRHHSWLITTNLPYDTRGLIEDMPFNGSGLFHANIDATLQDLDRSIKMSKTLGVSATSRPRRP